MGRTREFVYAAEDRKLCEPVVDSKISHHQWSLDWFSVLIDVSYIKQTELDVLIPAFIHNTA